MTTFELPQVFEEGPLFFDSLNEVFAAVASQINANIADIAALQATVTPPDLSAYATAQQLADHVAATVPHSLLVKWRSTAAIVGASLAAGNLVRVESAVVTLSGGAGTFTFGTPFANGVLACQATAIDASALAISLTDVTLADVDIVGTGTEDVCVTAWGW